MNSSRGITVVITLMAAGPALSLAQHLGPGDWVRVHTVGSPAQKLVGTVVAVDAESISLRVDPDTQATIVPKRAITRIEVSQGFDSALKAPVAAGAFGIAALAAGTYFGAADKSNKSTGSQILGGVLGFLVAGAGGIGGSLFVCVARVSASWARG